MNNNSELDRIAHEQEIEVLYLPCERCGSISIMTDDGTCYIGIDNSREMTEQELIVHKAHELGHCVTGSFYNRYSKFDIISKHEYRADKWAIKKLVPKDELVSVMKKGTQEIWLLAEKFNVTESFMIKACEMYGFYHRAG